MYKLSAFINSVQLFWLKIKDVLSERSCLFEVDIRFVRQIETVPFLKLVPERQIEHCVRSSTPVIGNESFVKAARAFHFECLYETVEYVVIEQTPATFVNACERNF